MKEIYNVLIISNALTASIYECEAQIVYHNMILALRDQNWNHILIDLDKIKSVRRVAVGNDFVTEITIAAEAGEKTS